MPGTRYNKQVLTLTIATTNDALVVADFSGKDARTSSGEWMPYTVNVNKPATWQVSFFVSSNSGNARLHLETDGANSTGAVSIPNTEGRQNWKEVKATIKLDAGQPVLKLVFDSRRINIDKMVFEEVK